MGTRLSRVGAFAVTAAVIGGLAGCASTPTESETAGCTDQTLAALGALYSEEMTEGTVEPVAEAMGVGVPEGESCLAIYADNDELTSFYIVYADPVPDLGATIAQSLTDAGYVTGRGSLLEFGSYLTSAQVDTYDNSDEWRAAFGDVPVYVFRGIYSGTGLSGTTAAEAIAESPWGSEEEPEPEAAPESAAPLVSLPISDSDGYEAVVNITRWEEAETFDASACSALVVDPARYASRAVVIAGNVEYPEVNGFTWHSPINIYGGAVDTPDRSDTSAPVIAAACALPASNSSAPVRHQTGDVAWVNPPASEFEVTIVYVTELNPNTPEGRFDEAGPLTQSFGIQNVFIDCSSVPADGFTAQASDNGGCTITRQAFIP